MDTRFIVGCLAGTVSALSGLRYIYAILQGTTQPNKVGWWIMSLICGMNVYFSVQAGSTAWVMPGISFLIMIAIAVLSLWFGEDVPMDATDKLCLKVSLSSLAFYAGLRFAEVGQAALFALFGSLIADFFGFLPTIRKSWRHPHTEDLASWAIALVGVLLNFGAIHWDKVDSLLHPDLVYNGYILGAMTVILVGLTRKRAS